MLSGDLSEVGNAESSVLRDVSRVNAVYEILQPWVMGDAANQRTARLGDHAQGCVGKALAGEGRHAFDDRLDALEGFHVRVQVQPSELLKQLVAPDV